MMTWCALQTPGSRRSLSQADLSYSGSREDETPRHVREDTEEAGKKKSSSHKQDVDRNGPSLWLGSELPGVEEALRAI